MRTGSWTQNGNAVSAEVDSAFLKSQLDAQATKIASELTALTGRQTAFSVHVRRPTKKDRRALDDFVGPAMEGYGDFDFDFDDSDE